jgi:hypothetical protein
MMPPANVLTGSSPLVATSTGSGFTGSTGLAAANELLHFTQRESSSELSHPQLLQRISILFFDQKEMKDKKVVRMDIESSR